MQLAKSKGQLLMAPERRKRLGQSMNGTRLWMCLVTKVEQYCIGTWNVSSMDQGQLDTVKQEMARVNINIIRISELKWTGMSEFNSDGHYIYYRG